MDPKSIWVVAPKDVRYYVRLLVKDSSRLVDMGGIAYFELRPQRFVELKGNDLHKAFKDGVFNVQTIDPQELEG